VSETNLSLFSGCATALVTPFLPGGGIDTASLQRLIQLQMDAGIDALVLLGTTGEPSTLTMQERECIISIAMELIGKKMPVIVGTGSNDTRKAIEYARQAKRLGADGQLTVTPYYNKTTQAGLLRHYNAILSACELPMIIYNVPSRTGMSIQAETAAEIALHPLIVGIKEASGDPSLISSIIHKTNGSLPVYCGNDDQIVSMMAMGAKGAISVISNILPSQSRAITHACLSGYFEEARAAQQSLLPLIHALFSQVNPIPVKSALSMMGLIQDELRLPLTPLDEPYRGRLKSTLSAFGLIS